MDNKKIKPDIFKRWWLRISIFALAFSIAICILAAPGAISSGWSWVSSYWAKPKVQAAAPIRQSSSHCKKASLGIDRSKIAYTQTLYDNYRIWEYKSLYQQESELDAKRYTAYHLFLKLDHTYKDLNADERIIFLGLQSSYPDNYDHKRSVLGFEQWLGWLCQRYNSPEYIQSRQSMSVKERDKISFNLERDLAEISR